MASSTLLLTYTCLLVNIFKFKAIVKYSINTHLWSYYLSITVVLRFSTVTSHLSHLKCFVVSEFEWISELVAPAATSRAADPDSSRLISPEQRNNAAPNRSSATAVDRQRERPDIATTIVSRPTIFNSNTVTTTSIPFTTTTNQISTTQSSAAKRHSKTPRTTIRTTTTESPKTTPTILPDSTSQSTKLDPSKSTLGTQRAAATEASMLRCNITDKMWIKTGAIAQIKWWSLWNDRTLLYCNSVLHSRPAHSSLS